MTTLRKPRIGDNMDYTKMMKMHNIRLDKVTYPCYISKKYDGVPVLFYGEDNSVKNITRQGKTLKSVEHIAKTLKYRDGFICCGELIIDDKDFPYISGKVRKQEPCTDLQMKIFAGDGKNINETVVNTEDELLTLLANMPKDIEGYMVRTSDVYQHGKRSWNVMKYKNENTTDLKIQGFVEAIDKHGEPKNMLGSFIVEFNGQPSNIPAGSLKHHERTEIWNNKDSYLGRMIEIKSKPDSSYKKLREPRFYRWRPDRD